jgi:hypothetical protein
MCFARSSFIKTKIWKARFSVHHHNSSPKVLHVFILNLMLGYMQETTAKIATLYLISEVQINLLAALYEARVS